MRDGPELLIPSRNLTNLAAGSRQPTTNRPLIVAYWDPGCPDLVEMRPGIRMVLNPFPDECYTLNRGFSYVCIATRGSVEDTYVVNVNTFVSAIIGVKQPHRPSGTLKTTSVDGKVVVLPHTGFEPVTSTD